MIMVVPCLLVYLYLAVNNRLLLAALDDLRIVFADVSETFGTTSTEFNVCNI